MSYTFLLHVTHALFEYILSSKNLVFKNLTCMVVKLEHVSVSGMDFGGRCTRYGSDCAFGLVCDYTDKCSKSCADYA